MCKVKLKKNVDLLIIGANPGGQNPFKKRNTEQLFNSVDGINNAYIGESVVRDLYSRTLLLLGFSIRYLFIFNLLSLQLLIFLFRLNNQSQNYIYILLANLQFLL